MTTSTKIGDEITITKDEKANKGIYLFNNLRSKTSFYGTASGGTLRPELKGSLKMIKCKTEKIAHIADIHAEAMAILLDDGKQYSLMHMKWLN